jgi:hypothetical protein
MYPPMIETTENKLISEIELPLMTICPSAGQIDYEELRALNTSTAEGLYLTEVLIGGIGSLNESLSWGAHLNKSFQQVLDQVRTFLCSSTS